MSRFNSKEQRMIDNACAAELNRLLKKRGIDPEELSASEMAALMVEAVESAEAGFHHYVDQQIDERKERKAFGDDR